MHLPTMPAKRRYVIDQAEKGTWFLLGLQGQSFGSDYVVLKTGSIETVTEELRRKECAEQEPKK